MENLSKKLENQLKEINLLVKKSNKSLRKFEDLPQGSIHVSTCNGRPQYYYVDKSSNTKKYMNASERKLVKRIIQRDYEFQVNKKLKELQSKLQKFVNSYDINEITAVYEKMNYGRKSIVEPFIQTTEDYVKCWYDEHPGQLNSYEVEGLFITNRGEHVRSKSEKIIADTLDKYGVPYQYEPSLELNGFHVVYPDFIVLNVKERKELYWEHLGLISEVEYAEKNFKKIHEYENNGFFLGRDLIITMESPEYPLNIKVVEAKIKELLL